MAWAWGLARGDAIAPQRLEFRQVLHRTLAALTGEFKPMAGSDGQTMRRARAHRSPELGG
jgi:hypothetical protein